MRSYAIALALSAAVLVPAPVLAQVQIETSGPVVELSITESVMADPDIANLSAGVTTLAPTAVAAMQQNATQMTRVIDRIESLGVDEDDIQTSGVTLNAEYEWDDATRQQRFRGYRVTNRVNVVLRDIERTGPALDALVAAGATDIGGIGWGIDDPSEAQDQARRAAFAAGRQRALDYARMAGFSDVRLLQVSENVMGGRPVAFAQAEAITVTGSRASDTPTRPGQVQAGVTVNFTYEFIQ